MLDRSIRLANNVLAGSLPDGLTLLTKLSAIDITNNAFIGSLPTGVSALSGLSSLLMSLNGITGTIPDTVTSLTKLRCVPCGSFCRWQGLHPWRWV